MAKEIVMPRLSDTMEEGKILKWHKRPGDEVHKGEILAEIETDKANMELEAYDTGVLTQIVVDEGGQVPIGQPIAYIGSASEVQQGGTAAQTAPLVESPSASAPAIAQPERPSEAVTAVASATPREESPAQPATTSTSEDGRIKASPLARRIASERGIDLHQVRGTGPGGRILRADVEAFQPSAAPVPAAQPVQVPASAIPAQPAPAQPAAQVESPFQRGQTVELNRMQQTIAKRMAASKQQAPHFQVTVEVDTVDLTELRKRLNDAGEEVRISYNDLIVKAVALALADMPLLNASWRDGSVYVNAEINVGIAVSVPFGLVVPVIHDADKKGVRAIAGENKAMVARTRENRMRQEDLQGATFTISNLGMYDVDEFTAIIDLPTVAILAVGSIAEKPVVRNGEIVIRETMRMTISADHRVVYGAEAAQFMQIVKRRLENPYSLLG